MGTLITGVVAYVTRLPLIRPYHLSFGSLKAYDSLIVRILADGKAKDTPSLALSRVRGKVLQLHP